MTQSLTNTSLYIRWMIRRDMPRILDIDRAANEVPWDIEAYLAVLRHRNCIGMIAEASNGIRGAMVYELHKTRLHILRFSVDPLFQRSGVGSAMMDKLFHKLCQQRRTTISIEVGERNATAIAFLCSQGFVATGLERDPFETEDVLKFEYVLGGRGCPHCGRISRGRVTSRAEMGARGMYKKGAGATWLKSNWPKLEPSELGMNVADLLNEWQAGIYHCDSDSLRKCDWTNPRYIKFSLKYTRLATWDFSDLTRLVFLAHDFCIRVEITPGSPQTVWLIFHGRKREGDMAERHPTLEQAVESHRERFPVSEQRCMETKLAESAEAAGT